MTALPKFQWQWRSRQGVSRSENRDTCGLFACESYTFAVIMDASSKGGGGTCFNELWVSELLKRLPSDTPTTDVIIRAMSDAQMLLRHHKLLLERACYAALMLPHSSKDAIAFICGDCCIGTGHLSQGQRWLTPTHTLASIFECGAREKQSINRNIVTRTLNAKRFEKPQIVELSMAERDTWILATDGYWASLSPQDSVPDDDSSFLMLGTALKQHWHSDCLNLLLSGLYAENQKTVVLCEPAST